MVAQSLVITRKSSVDLYADFMDLLRKANTYADVWLDTEYWGSDTVYIARVNNVYGTLVGKDRPGYVAISKHGLMLRIADDLSYINIESIHECKYEG